MMTPARSPRTPRLGGAFVRLALLVSLCWLGPACENELDDAPNVFPSVAVADAVSDSRFASEGQAEGASTTVCADCFEVGARYRFLSLAVDSLDRGDHPLLFILNALWEADIDRFELTVIFTIVEADDTHVAIEAMNGARLGEGDGTYCLLPETAETFHFAREDCALTMTEPAQLNIFAGTQTHPKNCAPDLPLPHAIPVQNVLISTLMSPDCQAFTEGYVPEAAIARADLAQVCTCTTTPDQYAEACGALDEGHVDGDGTCGGCNDNYTNLEAFMQQFQALEFLCETGEGDPAVCLEGRFDAARIDYTPLVCGE